MIGNDEEFVVDELVGIWWIGWVGEWYGKGVFFYIVDFYYKFFLFENVGNNFLVNMGCKMLYCSILLRINVLW